MSPKKNDDPLVEPLAAAAASVGTHEPDAPPRTPSSLSIDDTIPAPMGASVRARFIDSSPSAVRSKNGLSVQPAGSAMSEARSMYGIGSISMACSHFRALSLVAAARPRPMKRVTCDRRWAGGCGWLRYGGR